jgi:hypothetical protein
MTYNLVLTNVVSDFNFLFNEETENICLRMLILQNVWKLGQLLYPITKLIYTLSTYTAPNREAVWLFNNAVRNTEVSLCKVDDYKFV